MKNGMCPYFPREYPQNALHLLWILSLSAISLAVNQLYITIKRVALEVRLVIYVNLATMALTLGTSYLLMTGIGLIGAGLGWLPGQELGTAAVGVMMIRQLSEKGGGREL